MTPTLFEADELCKSFGPPDRRIEALKQVDFTISAGEFVAITGPSGSGKSTLLGLLGLLARPSSGRLHFQGADVAGFPPAEAARVRNREIGFVFQSFQLLDRTTALENVELPLVYANVAPAERHERARAALHAVGLGDRADQNAAQLSGGEQQRVAIARAMITAPSVILADEPTGALDTRTGAEVMELLIDRHRTGTAVVIITHNPDIAAVAGRQLTLVDGRLGAMTAAAGAAS